MNILKILVIDDSPVNQQSARETLTGHNLTVVGTYDEAYKLLCTRDAWDFGEYIAHSSKVDAVLAQRGFKHPDSEKTAEERAAYLVELERVKEELCPPQPFDVVLCDLLMPAGERMMGPKGEKYIGQEMPVGFALSLMAALQGAKYVAVVTATNHHDHPAGAMIDPFKSKIPQEYAPGHRDSVAGLPPRFTINGARVGYYEADMSTPIGECYGKNWGEVLAHLLAS